MSSIVYIKILIGAALQSDDILKQNNFCRCPPFLDTEEKLSFPFNSTEPKEDRRLYKTLKWKAIHFPKPARSGFNNMGWALPLYLPCCIFKAAILNYYIFFHSHEMRVADRAVVNSLRIKIGRVPWTRYVADRRATCFLLTSPITTNYLASGYVFATLDSEEKKSESSCWIKLENNRLTSVATQTCSLMTSVYKAKGTETSAQHVGCSVVINRGMWSASTLT